MSLPSGAIPYRAKVPYQPSLDGVRAMAVAMVLLFHGGVSWMGGGYFGVSVFFTLSGFLITTLLCAEFETNGRVAPGAFYMRRAKRLLPASVVCLSVVSILASADAWKGEGHIRRDVFGALGQVANWVRLFAGESYVDAQSRTAGLLSPLDHYWSLAIEEQFYWIWPLAFWAVARAARRRRRTITPIVAGITVVFALCAPLIAEIWGRDAAYWATPARASEILLGALAAVALSERYITPRAWMAPVGLACMVVFGVLLPAASGPAYVGAFPLLAVASATLLVGLQRRGVIAAVLAWSPLVALGRISYGVYLYHLPVYVYFTESQTGLNGFSLIVVRIALTLAAATLSYWLIERPIRRASWAGRGTALTAMAATALVAVLAITVPAAAASYWKVDSTTQARAAIPIGAPVTPLLVATTTTVATTATPPSNPDAAAPTTTTTPTPTTVAPTVLPAHPELSRPARILVVGDSTAEATGHGLVEWAAANPTLAQVSLVVSAGCGFVRGGVVPSDGKVQFQKACDSLLDQVLPDGLRSLQPDVVVLLVWARDNAPRKWSDAEGVLTAHDPRYAERILRDYRSITTTIVSTSAARVVWVRPPKGDNLWLGKDTPFSDESAHAIVEGVMRTVIGENPGRTELLDLRAWMERDGIATDHAVRPDGLHFTVTAATDVATRWLGPQLILAATRSVNTGPLPD